MLGPDCWGLIFSAACWYGVAQLGLTFTRNGNNEMKFGDRLGWVRAAFRPSTPRDGWIAVCRDRRELLVLFPIPDHC